MTTSPSFSEGLSDSFHAVRIRRWRAEKREMKEKELVRIVDVFKDLKLAPPARGSIRYWISAGFIEVAEQGHKLQYIKKSDAPVVVLMYLLNKKLGLKPGNAKKVAEAFVNRGVKTEGTYWLKINGITIGIPLEKLP